MGEQIQRSGSTVDQVRPLKESEKILLGGYQKLLSEGAVYVLKHVEVDRCRIVVVLDGCQFWSGGAFRDDGRCSEIGQGHD